jgi:quercetin dioxygenase-like cupin family protein
MREKAVDTSIILAPGDGKGTAPGGLRQIKIKITGESTGGKYSMVEDTVPPQYRTSLHIHRNTDEAFYVVDGALRFQLGEDKIEAPTGAFLFIPRGVHHAFMNPTAEPATYIVVLSPPGFEKYFEERALVANANPTPETLTAISKRHDREDTGPLMAL